MLLEDIVDVLLSTTSFVSSNVDLDSISRVLCLCLHLQKGKKKKRITDLAISSSTDGFSRLFCVSPSS